MQSERARRVTRTALIVFSIATLSASEAGKLFGPDGVDWAKGAGVFLWPSVFVTMAVTCRWGLRRQETRAAEPLPVFRYLSSAAIMTPSPRTDEQI